jgi:acetamidase/formamidase
MSGSGGGSSRIDAEVGTGGQASPNVCSSVDVETFLNSPNPVVVKNLRRGDALDVCLEKTKTGVITLVAKDAKGKIAGSLTPAILLTIINCIESGYQYVAVVLDDVKNAVVRVRIREKR